MTPPLRSTSKRRSGKAGLDTGSTQNARWTRANASAVMPVRAMRLVITCFDLCRRSDVAVRPFSTALTPARSVAPKCRKGVIALTAVGPESRQTENGCRGLPFPMRAGYADHAAGPLHGESRPMPMPAQITHVVVLMMENHSFDRALGCMQTVDPRIEGVDPAHPRANPNWPNAAPPVLQGPTESRAIDKDPGHDLDNVLRQIANGNQGFVADFAQKYPSTAEERNEIMAYYPHGFLPALHHLADNFVVCDHWFSSLPGPTWPNRFFAHSGTSLGHVDMPEGIFNPDLHLYDQRTLYDELDDAHVDWRIYYGDFPQSLLMTHQLDKLAHYRKFDQWTTDVSTGNLPPYVFIEPSYFSTEENDQHPPQDVMRGDVLIANVFNALLANQAVFERTLLVVLYDEHGGFYDHVEPPATVAPDGNTKDYAFNQLGV